MNAAESSQSQLPTGSEALVFKTARGYRRCVAYWEHGLGTVTYRVAFKGKRGGPACVLFTIPIDLFNDPSWPSQTIHLDLVMYYPECCAPNLLVRGESSLMLKAACVRVWSVVKEVYTNVQGITLSDESEIDCIDTNGTERKVSLADLKALVSGNTWYGHMKAECMSSRAQKVLDELNSMRSKPIATSKEDLMRTLVKKGHPFLRIERKAIGFAYDEALSLNPIVSTSDLLQKINSWDVKNNSGPSTDVSAALGIQGCWLSTRLFRFLMEAYPDQIQSLRGSLWIFRGSVIDEWAASDFLNVDDLVEQSGGGVQSDQVFRQRQTRVKNQVDNIFKDISARRKHLLSG